MTATTIEPRPISFQSEGDTVRGLLYLPEGPGPHPTVIMAGGWCYVKELVQPRYAQAFADHGFAALVFDYRGFGDSDGDPRQHADPVIQIEDYRNALSHVEGLAEVDASRLAVWGISYSGGHALVVGAVDPRVRVVMSVVPVVDGLETMRRAHGTMGFRRLVQVVLDDRRERFRTGQPGYAKHSSEDPANEVCCWPFPGSPPLFQSFKDTVAPNYENRNTIASIEKLLEYSVVPHVERLVETPTLFVLAEGDDFTFSDLEMAAFNRIPTVDKRTVVIDGADHHGLYQDPAKTALAADACLDWLREHL